MSVQGGTDHKDRPISDIMYSYDTQTEEDPKDPSNVISHPSLDDEKLLPKGSEQIEWNIREEGGTK